MDSVEIKDEERPFDVKDLFYSRTDKRGVIATGNTVFQEVSGYEWDDLLGAPHKVIRHPDTPKGVFWLMWHRIKMDRPTAAYIKNRAKDGSYYWVLANVTPTDEGYFSIRLKPTSDMLPKVEEIYAKLLKAEADGTSPDDSAELLRELISEHGYQGYEEFSAAALSAEVAARVAVLEREVEPTTHRLQNIADAVVRIEKAVAEVVSTFRGIRMVPSNMRIMATRLEPTGGPISTIAVNYAFMAREMETWVQNFLGSEESGYRQMRHAIARAQYLHNAAEIQREGADDLTREASEQENSDLADEEDLLKALAHGYENDALKALDDLAQSARRLSVEQAEMKRYVTGLASTRTLCRVENARLGDEGGALDGIINNLDAFQSVIDEKLTEISQENQAIRNELANLTRTREIEAEMVA